MRLPLLLATISLGLAASPEVHAQGRLLPRPCDTDGRPTPCNNRVERLSSSVVVSLVDRVLRYEVTEIFRNNGPTIAEADYVFPLPTGAAFKHLFLSINGELVAGETMDADKARGIYEEIVRRQRDPALVEWMGSGMLRTRIFPIAPGEEKKVVVKFEALAQREGDALRVDYRRGTDPSGNTRRDAPTAVQADARAAGTNETGERGTWSRLTLRIPRDNRYGEPYSPTHELRTRDVGSQRVVDARGASGDITILVPLRVGSGFGVSALTHAPEGESGYALIAIRPPSTVTVSQPRDITFVVDVSGSMAGHKLVQAKAAGRALLESLRPGDRFRIVDFSTDVREFRDREWTTVTDGNLRDARRYIDALRAEGSTNISGALDAALDLRSDGERLPLVLFVTDGEPTIGERDPHRLAERAERTRGNARIFSIGVTSGIDATLIEQLAIAGRGTAHFVRETESIDATMSLLARRLSSPVLTDARVTVNGVRVSHMLPAGPIDVFAGQDLILLARYDGSGSATVRVDGRGPNGPVTWSSHVHFASRERGNPFVARLWAAQRIGWLAAEKRRNGGHAELDEEIRSLGSRFGIPTEFSSYLVLEPGMTPPAVAAPPVRGQAANAVVPQSAAAAAPSRRDAQGSASGAAFEAARTAADQRAAKTTAALDSDGAARDVRTIGSRRFVRSGDTWSDQRVTTTMRTIRVQPYSALYFELMQRISDLRAIFALGDNVSVAGRQVGIVLDSNGQSAVDDALLRSIVRDW